MKHSAVRSRQPCPRRRPIRDPRITMCTRSSGGSLAILPPRFPYPPSPKVREAVLAELGGDGASLRLYLTPESIVKKLKRDGYESTIENMRNYINDIAGIRIVCSFTSDIYRLAEMIGKQNDLTVICVKDYIKNPKVSGYKSFHMHVTVPIFLSDRVVNTKVEIQIRTIAMDFWASLEHKIYYKFEGHAPEYISRDLRACAEIVSNLDAKMLQLNEAILEEKEKEEQKKKEE